MACWDCLCSAGIDPTMPGLSRSLLRGVDRASCLLPGPCRLRRTCARTPQGHSSSLQLAPVGDGVWRNGAILKLMSKWLRMT